MKSVEIDGFCKLSGTYPSDVLEALRDEAEQLVTRTYTPSELDRHSVYPSDSGEARISHAVMIAEGESEFPKVDHHDLTTITRFLHDHNALLGAVTGRAVPTYARCMLNYQNYFEGSKPVGEHFDGEYLRTERAGDGIEFTLQEGILPRYVAVLVVANQNNGKGTELVDNQRKKVHKPVLNPGDLLFFDNIRLRHRVPTMELPRTTIGIRNFDHMALHFVQAKRDRLPANYKPIAEGWVSDEVDCHERMSRFMNDEWPLIKQDYSHYF